MQCADIHESLFYNTVMGNAAWTPRRGIVRALVLGFATAVFLSMLLAPIAVFAPAILINGVLRAVVSFVVGWLLFVAVHSAGGMTGGLLTSVAVFYAALVMLSNHVAWAVFGAPLGDAGEIVTGWQYWFDPMLLGLLNIFVAIPLAFCAALCRDGAPGPDLFCYLSTLPVWFSRRS